MATKLQIRRDTAANWTSANPTLSAGEFGFETDTYKLKIGNGSSAWTSLAYYDDQISGLDSTAAIGLLSNGSVQHIIPAGNELYDLGDSNNRFRDLYLSGNTLNLGGATLSADESGVLTLPSTLRIGETTLEGTGGSLTIGDSGGVALDSAAVLGFINAAYIQSNQITYNNNDFADSAFVTAQINNLIDGAPGTLDTLNEIAAALNDDDSAYATLLNLINAKSDLDSAAVTSLIDSSYIQLRRPAETIMTVTGDGANYYFTGDGFPSTSSGDPTLYLTRGKTYQFEGISGSHPFEIRQSAGGSAYSTGVTNNGGSGTVIFTVPMDAPASLVYQCTVHSGMVGDIVILDNSAGSGVDSAAVTALIDSAYIQARQTSGGSGGVDSAATLALIDSDYVSARIPSNLDTGFQWYSYTATAGQTTFQDSDNSGNILSYDPNGILVFYNGVLVTPNDFTASDGSSVVLGTGADSGTNIAITKWNKGSAAGGSTFFGDRAVHAIGYQVGIGASDIIEYWDITTTGNSTDFGDLQAATFYSPPNAPSNGTRGIYAGGSAGGATNRMDYITIATTGNASDFGDYLFNNVYFAGFGDGTYGIWGGGVQSGARNEIGYVTIATTGNASDFGDLTAATENPEGGCDGTYGLFARGYRSGNMVNNIDYITTATPGNASDFGDTNLTAAGGVGVSNTTYALFAGGYNSSFQASNAIDYVTIATPGNGSDFGDLTANGTQISGSGNGTRACFAQHAQSTTIDYVTFATPGNATDFGDITNSYGGSGLSGSPS